MLRANAVSGRYHAGSGGQRRPVRGGNEEPVGAQAQHGHRIGEPLAVEIARQVDVAHRGHIHEARGNARIGRTLCINPGSSYEQGDLLGAVIDLDGKKKVKRFLLTSG